MENQQEKQATNQGELAPAEQHQHQDCHDKYKRRKVLALLTLLFLVGTTAGVSLLYITAANTAADKDEEIVSLRSEIGTLKHQASAQAVADEQAEGDEIDEDEQSDQAETVSYTSEVGKFRLEVVQPFTLIVNNDGGFEGGPLASIEVGKTAENGHIEGSVLSSATVSAVTTQQNTIESTIEGWSTTGVLANEVDSIKIDGIEARVFEIPGIGPELRILLEQNDRLITINVASLETESAKALINGISFVDN